MATIQIRDIPDEEYEALRAAASAEGKSLQSYMREQTGFLARVARKRSVFERVRAELADRDEPGVTTESVVSDLDDIRGRWPEDEDASHRGR
ncbi:MULTISPECIES: FitA-like ribbon-helix-helix domain-containing protein [Prauserella salsuginis group]|uniref:Plasmid stability protein n=2 Tax=Prauserella salsuginis group TaxID=2893672 RepID=A0A839XWR7_9PSEU|nr:MULTISPECIES: antitoxin [Prauserella salsuginis group]MBB3664923.1 plasmid stability protein [Prauserella sediminis]MCR3718393.1 hypothetical protein [Prauserella flava]MCR3732963.1 hypothetical protein [Prauserella salsuginis]